MSVTLDLNIPAICCLDGGTQLSTPLPPSKSWPTWLNNLMDEARDNIQWRLRDKAEDVIILGRLARGETGGLVEVQLWRSK